MALLLVGAFVVAALLFGGGFWTGSVAGSIPGLSDGRDPGPRFGPGGGRMGDGPLPRRERHNSGTDSEGSTDPSSFLGS